MNGELPGYVRRSIRRHLFWGLLIVVFLLGGVGAWASVTEVSGAVIAPGVLVVDSSSKKVQHPTGGVVGELHVRDGDHVKAGEILVRLDDTITRANLGIVESGLIEAIARRARLEAERDSSPEVTVPREFIGQVDEPEIERALSGERRLFEMRRSARNGQKNQLIQRIAEIEQQISGLEIQANAKADELALVRRELASAQQLWDQNLMPISKFTEIQREATRVEAEKGALLASAAETKGKVSETDLQIIQVDRDLSSEVSKDLRDTEAKIEELQERKIAAEDQLNRINIRAPQDGVVHQSTVHTVGGVVAAGEAIMLIVPETDNLVVEAKVSPQEIDQLRLGLNVGLRFTAFNVRTTPEITGTVNRISADITTDQRTGLSYYIARITTTPGRDRQAWQCQADPWNARGSSDRYRRAHGAFISCQADAGPDRPGFPRKIATSWID